MKKVRILLVGVGGYGSNYIREMTEENVTSAEIAGICDIMPDVTTTYPVITEKKIPLYHTVEEFYEKQDADLAVISTPIHLHYDQIKYCLLHGSHVLTEKPVCTSVEDARELMRLSEKTGHFVSVGYQLNYSGDVLALKKDIMEGKFGRPLSMKALHAMSRGMNYYHRNSWAGKIKVHDCAVNDSPFNNACAHQFQNMTFLLGDAMNRAAEIQEVSAELYRANCEVENFDTAAVYALTTERVPLYYYTTHDLKEKKLGPMAEYTFEKAKVCFGKEYNGIVKAEYTVEWNDGTLDSYEMVPKGKRLQKLYDAIDCVQNGGTPPCTIQCAIPHLEVVNRLADLPVIPIKESELEHVEEDGDRFCRIRNLREIFTACYQNRTMPSQEGAGWN